MPGESSCYPRRCELASLNNQIFTEDNHYLKTTHGMTYTNQNRILGMDDTPQPVFRASALSGQVYQWVSICCTLPTATDCLDIWVQQALDTCLCPPSHLIRSVCCLWFTTLSGDSLPWRIWDGLYSVLAPLSGPAARKADSHHLPCFVVESRARLFSFYLFPWYCLALSPPIILQSWETTVLSAKNMSFF